MALFPEMTLTGYSLEDLVLQDAVLDDVERALATVVEGTADLLPLIVIGAPLRHRNRIYNCAVVIHRGAILGVVPKSYPPTYREFYEGRQLASGVGERGEIRVGGAAVPFGTDLLFAAERRARPRRPRRGLRGHVDPDPAERRGGAGGRDRPAQPVRQPDHRRPGGGPQAAVPLGVLALPGRLRLLRRRPGRVVDRPGVGRPDHDLRERRAAGRDRALQGRRPPRGGRRRPRPAAPGAAAHGHVRRQPARARAPTFRRVGFTLDPPGGDLGLLRSVERYPFVPADVARLDLDCYEAYNIQVAGPAPAAARDRRPEGRDRRLRRARLDAGAARRRPGDGPRRPPAQRHPRLHAPRLRHQRRHQGQRAQADGRRSASPPRRSTSSRPRS